MQIILIWFFRFGIISVLHYLPSIIYLYVRVYNTTYARAYTTPTQTYSNFYTPGNCARAHTHTHNSVTTISKLIWIYIPILFANSSARSLIDYITHNSKMEIDHSCRWLFWLFNVVVASLFLDCVSIYVCLRMDKMVCMKMMHILKFCP